MADIEKFNRRCRKGFRRCMRVAFRDVPDMEAEFDLLLEIFKEALSSLADDGELDIQVNDKITIKKNCDGRMD